MSSAVAGSLIRRANPRYFSALTSRSVLRITKHHSSIEVLPKARGPCSDTPQEYRAPYDGRGRQWLVPLLMTNAFLECTFQWAVLPGPGAGTISTMSA
jgi:hypothetical protein